MNKPLNQCALVNETNETNTASWLAPVPQVVVSMPIVVLASSFVQECQHTKTLQNPASWLFYVERKEESGKKFNYRQT